MKSEKLYLSFDVGRFGQIVTNDKDILLAQLKRYSKIVVFADINAYAYHEEFFKDIKTDLLIKLIPSERTKSLDYAYKIMNEIAEKDLDRNSCFIAFGGGFVGDIAGYIAAQFMRGVDLIQIPTTFMAMGDCIIGKVAINCKNRKNLFGSFSTPVLTIINTSLISTLPSVELDRGMVEVLKHFFISNSPYLKKTLQEGYTEKDYYPLISESINIKQSFVMKDPFDTNGFHKALSYGHTIANALETLDKENFKHGDAVLIGMIIAAKISFKLGMLNEDYELHQRLCHKLIGKIGTEFSPKPEFVREMITLLKKDKMSNRGNIHLVLLHAFGKFDIFGNVPEELIYETILEPLV